MSALFSMVKVLLEEHKERFAGERVLLAVEETSPFDGEAYKIIVTARPDRKGARWRDAQAEVTARELVGGDGSAIRVLSEKVSGIVASLFPAPPPKNFRRLRRRGTAA